MIYGKRFKSLAFLCIVISTLLVVVFYNNTSSHEFRTIIKSKIYRSILEDGGSNNMEKERYSDFRNNEISSTQLYIITPTYDRATQIPDLVRLSQTLRNVENLHWIVIEDGKYTLPHVKNLLEKSSLSYTYLSATTNGLYRNLKGMAQRNLGMEWIRQNHPEEKNGVVYFADDDNAYSNELFEEIRKTKKVSVIPVGFSGGLVFETPIVQNGKVMGFIGWARNIRKFPLDMAGFALNVHVLFDYPNMTFESKTPTGFMETRFLNLCCKTEELEPLAYNCTKVLVWHIRTQKPRLGNKRIDKIDWNITRLIPRLNLIKEFYGRKYLRRR